MDDSNKWIYHQIEKSPHGLCIIFNNYFDGDNYREGTDIDKNNLEATFTDLGYKIIVHNNYHAQTIKDELNNYCLGCSKKIDSLFVCFLTHGGKNYICGNDYKPICYSELTKIFSQNGCVFNNIPKVIINQACSGGTSFGRGQDATNIIDELDIDPELELNSNPEYENYKHFVILSASSPGTIALRTEHGSPFVHHLCKVLRKYAYDHAFHKMVILLRDEMGKSTCCIEGGEKCTPPTPYGTLDKLFFIHPFDKDMTEEAVVTRECKMFDEKFCEDMHLLRSFDGFVLDIGATDRSKNDNLYYDVILKTSGSVAVKIRVMSKEKSDKIFHNDLKKAKQIAIKDLSIGDNTLFYNKQMSGSSYQFSNVNLPFSLNTCSYLELSRIHNLPCDRFFYNIRGYVSWVGKEFKIHTKKYNQERRIRRARITDDNESFPLTVWNVMIDEINDFIKVGYRLCYLDYLKSVVFQEEIKLETTLITKVSWV